MLDDKTKALIIKYLRKAWLYSPARRQVIKEAETGQKTLEGEKIYRCYGVDGTEVHDVTKIYIDHEIPFVLVTGFDSWNNLISRLFSSPNMRAMCKLHHAIKTKEENKQRKRRTK